MTHSPLFEEMFIAGNRTYILSVRASVGGDRYLSLKEVPHTQRPVADHPQVLVFDNHAEAFLGAFLRASAHLSTEALTNALASAQNLPPKVRR